MFYTRNIIWIWLIGGLILIFFLLTFCYMKRIQFHTFASSWIQPHQASHNQFEYHCEYACKRKRLKMALFPSCFCKKRTQYSRNEFDCICEKSLRTDLLFFRFKIVCFLFVFSCLPWNLLVIFFTYAVKNAVSRCVIHIVWRHARSHTFSDSVVSSKFNFSSSFGLGSRKYAYQVCECRLRSSPRVKCDNVWLNSRGFDDLEFWMDGWMYGCIGLVVCAFCYLSFVSFELNCCLLACYSNPRIW